MSFARGRLVLALTAVMVMVWGTLASSATKPASSTSWKTNGNAAKPSDFLGTTNNQALVIKVDGQRVVRYQPTSGTPNIIGGSSANSAAPGIEGATISGGGLNSVGGDFSTVGGGSSNTASGGEATVGGGGSNIASGGDATVGGGTLNTASNVYSTVGGGAGNTASDFSATVGGGVENSASDVYSTVAGGSSNTASYAATVGGGVGNSASGNSAAVSGGNANTASGRTAALGGGFSNTASNVYATVAGGAFNTASGIASFAAGNKAMADDDGSFAWADNSDFEFHSSTFPCTGQASCTPTSGVNTFNVRATGGVRFVTSIDGSGDATNGCYLDAGGSGWNCVSDRRAKRAFQQVDYGAVLRALAHMDVTTWSYKSQSRSIRHMGPTAQAFFRAVHLGSDRGTINSIDAQGVTLAAIRGLYAKVVAERASIGRLTREVHRLQGQLTRQRGIDHRQDRDIRALRRMMLRLLAKTGGH